MQEDRQITLEKCGKGKEHSSRVIYLRKRENLSKKNKMSGGYPTARCRVRVMKMLSYATNRKHVFIIADKCVQNLSTL